MSPPETLPRVIDLTEDDEEVKREKSPIIIDQTKDEEEEGGVKIEKIPEASLSSIIRSQKFHALVAEIFKLWQEKEYGDDNSKDDDEPAVFLNKSGRSPRQKSLRPLQDARTVTTRPQQQPQYQDRDTSADEQYSSEPPVRHTADYPPMDERILATGEGLEILNSMSGTQQTRIRQMERLQKTEEELQPFVEEVPFDIKLRGRWLSLQHLKRKLEEEQGQALNSDEQEVLRNIGRYIKRQKGKSKSKDFERLAAVETQAARLRDGGVRSASAGGDDVMKRKETPDHEDIAPSSLVETGNQAATSPCLPSHHPTTGGKTIPQDQTHEKKRARLADDVDGGYPGEHCGDAEKEEENDEGEGERGNVYGALHVTFGNVEMAYGGGNTIMRTEEEGETEQEDDDSGDESSDDGTDDSSDTDSETDTSV